MRRETRRRVTRVSVDETPRNDSTRYVRARVTRLRQRRRLLASVGASARVTRPRPRRRLLASVGACACDPHETAPTLAGAYFVLHVNSTGRQH